MLSYKQELTAAGLNERLASKTHDTTIAGRYTFSNTENSIDFNSGALRVKGGGYVEKDLLIGQVLKASDIEIIKNLNLNSFSDLTTTGANSDLDVTNKTAVILLNSDLESISNISGKSKDKFLIIVNSTGAEIELNHSDTPLNDTKIISSSGASIKVKDSSFVILFYCEPLSGWLVVNGGGSSEGSGVTVVASIEDRDNIPAPQITDGMLVVVQDVGNEEYATFQRRGASWYNVELCITVLNYADISGLDATLLRTGFFVYVSSENRMYQHVNGSWNKVITASSSDVITNKDIDGGTASNTSRITVSKGTKAELLALDRKQGTLLFATDELVLYYDNGTSLIPLGAQEGTDTMIAHTFKANGNYQTGTGIDGIFVLPWSAKISNVILSNEIVGSSGTTNIDIKTKPQGSGSFESIFSTTPKLASSAGSNAWVGVGDTVTGGTAAVLTDANRVFDSKDGFRMDILGVQDGSPAEMAITIYFEKV